MSEVPWNTIGGNFESHPSANQNLKKKGDSISIEFVDDGSLVTKEQIKQARDKKGSKSTVPPSDNYVFTVTDLKTKETKSLWMKTTMYTNLGELKEIREANNNTLVGAKAKITKVQTGDATRPSLKIEQI